MRPPESDSQKRAYAIHKRSYKKMGFPMGESRLLWRVCYTYTDNLFYYKERIGLPNIENRLKVIPKKDTYNM